MRRNRYTFLYIIGLGLSFLWMSCDDKTVYSHYQHVSIAGWEKNDPLSYGVAPMEHDGTLQENIGVRINGTYPFMGLTLIIDQTIHPSMEQFSDTLVCELIDEGGNAKGQGISHYQYTFPLQTVSLHKGDSLSIRIRHDMKREILPGVADIGVTLKR